jgi:hypothetical protein
MRALGGKSSRFLVGKGRKRHDADLQYDHKAAHRNPMFTFSESKSISGYKQNKISARQGKGKPTTNSDLHNVERLVGAETLVA